MNKRELLIQKVRGYDFNNIHELWELILDGKTLEQGWQRGTALEYLIVRLFELYGAQVEYPFNGKLASSGRTLEEFDGLIQYRDYRVLLECKDTAVPVKYDVVAKLKAQIQRRPIFVGGSIFAKSGFKESAEVMAVESAREGVLLWNAIDINEVVYCRRNICEALELKFWWLVKRVKPDYNIGGPWKR